MGTGRDEYSRHPSENRNTPQCGVLRYGSCITRHAQPIPHRWQIQPDQAGVLVVKLVALRPGRHPGRCAVQDARPTPGIWDVPAFVHKSGGFGGTNDKFSNVCFSHLVEYQYYSRQASGPAPTTACTRIVHMWASAGCWLRHALRGFVWWPADTSLGEAPRVWGEKTSEGLDFVAGGVSRVVNSAAVGEVGAHRQQITGHV